MKNNWVIMNEPKKPVSTPNHAVPGTLSTKCDDIEMSQNDSK